MLTLPLYICILYSLIKENTIIYHILLYFTWYQSSRSFWIKTKASALIMVVIGGVDDDEDGDDQDDDDVK